MNSRFLACGLLSMATLVTACGPSMGADSIDIDASSRASLSSARVRVAPIHRVVFGPDAGDEDAGAPAMTGGCEGDADCASGDFCSDGVCKARALNGGACTTSAECGSGSCVDGVCCDTACDGECETCTARGSVGTCAPVNGPSCERCQVDGDCASSDFCSNGICKARALNGGACTDADSCGSGNCVDGVCCDTACDGEGETCIGRGSVGTCTQVVG